MGEEKSPKYYQLARMMFQLGICERRGSGIDRAIEAVEKISACYQHACLMYEDGEAGLIKPADNETTSKKYLTYIPFYGFQSGH